MAAARAHAFRLIVPATVVTEFLLGHPRDRPRADRVLGVLEPIDVSAAIGRRAAFLLGRLAVTGHLPLPSVTDGTVAAMAEVHGAVITNDPDDLAALAAAGTGFDVYSVADLVAEMRRRPKRR